VYAKTHLVRARPIETVSYNITDISAERKMRQMIVISTALAGLIMHASSAQQLYRSGVPDVATPQGAQGLYRNDTPITLDPPRQSGGPSAEDQILSRFQNVYIQRKRPKLAIFWNRALDDQVATTYRDDMRIRSGGGSTSLLTDETEFNRFGSSRIIESNNSFQNTTDVSRRTGPAESAPKRPGFDELTDWQFENGFVNAFLVVGGQLVDRNVLIRTSAEARSASGQVNLQAVESAALAARADYIMEILQTPDRSSPSGFTFRVTVKDLRTGAVAANVVTRASKASQSSNQYVATDKGFERATRRQSIDETGDQLAVETMAALLRVWR
jgi:hypothetical protein